MVKALGLKARLDPILLAPHVIAHVRVAHSRQITGGIFGCVSGRALAVDYNLFGFVRQEAGREFAQISGRQVYGSGQVRVLVGMRGERFDQLERLAAIDLLLQLFAGYCIQHYYLFESDRPGELAAGQYEAR